MQKGIARYKAPEEILGLKIYLIAVAVIDFILLS